MIVEVLFEIFRDALSHFSVTSSAPPPSPFVTAWLPAFITAIFSACAALGVVVSVRKRRASFAPNGHKVLQHITSQVDDEDPAMRNDNGPKLLQSKRQQRSDNVDDDYDDDDDDKLPLDLLQAPRIVYQPATDSSAPHMLESSAAFFELMRKRRSVREFDPMRTVPHSVIENIISTAGSAPSGANLQPWTYVVISDKLVKAEVRRIIEEEEEMNYRRRMGDKWVRDVTHLGTDWRKSYLEDAPYLVVVMKQTHSENAQGKQTHYYCDLSVSISVGLLLCAIQNAGLVSVTTTPLNAGPRLRILLNRPSNEKVLLLLPIGFAAPNCTIPDIQRKPLKEILIQI